LFLKQLSTPYPTSSSDLSNLNLKKTGSSIEIQNPGSKIQNREASSQSQPDANKCLSVNKITLSAYCLPPTVHHLICNTAEQERAVKQNLQIIFDDYRGSTKTPLLTKEGWQPLRLTGWFVF
jgi:hypothetical protein